MIQHLKPNVKSFSEGIGDISEGTRIVSEGIGDISEGIEKCDSHPFVRFSNLLASFSALIARA
jgi:hypothetical protein